MATIAKGMITLSSVNDAYSVSLSPSSCVISASWNGSDPDYSNAKTTIIVYRGDTPVEFSVSNIIATNIEQYGIDYKVDKSQVIEISKIKSGALSGSLKFYITAEGGFETWVTWPFSVVRETSMLDWILDWEQNKKTSLSGDYILTPKIYAGDINDGKLTGTYIGPAFDSSGRTGVFGYNNNVEIFHLDNTGGMIGGWTIDEYGIRSGKLQLLSSGSIQAVNDDGIPVWAIKGDGSAFFGLDEGISLDGRTGNATFKGTLEAEKGKIGGWNIGEDVLQSGGVVLDSDYQLIGVLNQHTYNYTTGGQFVRDVALKGGVYMLYSDTNDYGLRGYSLENKQVFCLGSTNQIAGWHFNEDSLWSGEDNGSVYARVNTEGRFTTIPGAITIGSKGLRGNGWRFEKDGSGAVANGNIYWESTGAATFKGTLEASTIKGSKISGGTITAVDYIKSEDGSWQLNSDGSGWLANSNVEWGTDGKVDVRGGLRADTLEMRICSTMENGFIDGNTGTFISPNAGETATLILPKLSVGAVRVFHLMLPFDNKKFRIGFPESNTSYSLVGEDKVPDENKNGQYFDEEGYAVLNEFGGEWFELIGIKTVKSNIQSLLNIDIQSFTANHIYYDGSLRPFIAPTSDDDESGPSKVAGITYQTHWFFMPKSAYMINVMMRFMEIIS